MMGCGAESGFLPTRTKRQDAMSTASAPGSTPGHSTEELRMNKATMAILSMAACMGGMPGFGDPVYRARVVDRPEGDAFEALAVAAARRERRKQERLANDAKREAGIRKARGE